MIDQPAVPSSSTPAHRTSRRFWLAAAAITLAVIVGLIVLNVARLGAAAWDAYQAAKVLQADARSGSPLERLPTLQTDLNLLSQRLDALNAEVQPLAPILHRLGFIPRYGPLVAAAPELLTAARAGLAAAREGVALAAPALSRVPKDASTAEQATALLSAVAPRLPELRTSLQSTQQALASIAPGGLPDGLAGPLADAADAAGLAARGAAFGPSLPWLLGMDGPRTYLVLVQNNHELRPTGGFIAAIGKIIVNQGRLESLDFSDSYAVYHETSAYPPAPGPMQRFMGIPVLVMRDANWSPDLPTTAEVARALYAQDTGTQVDGIFTVDLHAVKELMRAVEPVTLGDDANQLVITADNIEDQVVHLWEQPAGSGATIDKGLGDWWSQRKNFIPALAKAVLAKVQSGAANPLAGAAALQTALEQRAIQAWTRDPQTQAALAAAGWDGGLHPQAGKDYLAVVNMNMGYNKVDKAMERGITYAVSWPNGASQPAEATVTLTYTHPIAADDPGCNPAPRYGKTYADLVARCYFDFVRVYAPGGSELLHASGLADGTQASQPGEYGTQVFSGYFVLPPGHSHTVTFTYRLPAGLSPDRYGLVLQRQSGSNPLPVTLHAGDHALQTILDAGLLNWQPMAAP